MREGEKPLAERVKEIVPCPNPGCDGIAGAWVEYPDTGGGTGRECTRSLAVGVAATRGRIKHANRSNDRGLP